MHSDSRTENTPMEIVPFTSVGLIQFGDSRSVARQKLASQFSVFEKVAGENETDSFDELGMHLYYDSEGRVEFIETFNPAKVQFRGISFMGLDVRTLTRKMQLLGILATESDVGIDFPSAGIAITAPEGIIEGVAAHRRGYYD